MKWEKTYDDNKLSNASKKRFVAAKNLCRSGGQLRLVVSKIRKRRMDKNNFVGVSVEIKPCSRAMTPSSYAVSAVAELFFCGHFRGGCHV